MWFSFCLPSDGEEKEGHGSFLWERLTEGKLGLFLMGGPIFTKSLIQFSVDGQGCVPFLLSDLRPNYGGGNEDNGDLLQNVLYSVPLTLQQATVDPWLCWNLLDTHRQVWVSLMWGHCSFLLGSGESRFSLCPPKVSIPSPV